jgi:peroxiredoxin
MSSLPTKAVAYKRWFVAPYFGGNLLALIYSLVRLAISVAGSGDDAGAWAVAAAMHATVLAYAARSWPRRTSGLGGLLALTGAGTVALVAMLPGSLAQLLVSGVLAFGGSLLYVLWYSRFGRTPSPLLRNGSLLPELELRTLDGSLFSTTELRGAPAALFFFRGNWCPFCSAQVNEVAAGYRDLADRGVAVAMISPQPEAETRKLAERLGVDLLWLVDDDLSAAWTLGIVDAYGVPAGARGFGVDTVLPTLVVIDAEGRVLASEQTDSYRLRPDSAAVAEILDRSAPAGAISSR